ncbi:MAG: TonB family protein [Desulfobacterales bacterium]|nr:TonB family protein [Desulfobacterales bacterium]
MSTGQAHMASVKIHHAMRDWLIALVVASGLNIALFSFMPGLIQSIPKASEVSEPLQHVRVIRVKRAESPPRKKEPERIIQHKPKQQKADQTINPMKNYPKPMLAAPNLTLGNPVLPKADLHINAPLLDDLDLKVPSLKSSYEVGELDYGLTTLSRVQPIYPFKAKRRGIEGYVTVEFIVSPQGMVQDITIIKADPKNTFDQAVTNCLKLWRFRPPMVEGIPVSAKARTTIRFKLEG